MAVLNLSNKRKLIIILLFATDDHLALLKIYLQNFTNFRLNRSRSSRYMRVLEHWKNYNERHLLVWGRVGSYPRTTKLQNILSGRILNCNVLDFNISVEELMKMIIVEF